MIVLGNLYQYAYIIPVHSFDDEIVVISSWSGIFLSDCAKTHWSHSLVNKEQLVEEMIIQLSTNFATTPCH